MICAASHSSIERLILLLGRLITKAGEIGEMIVRSGSMTTGYCRGLELTAFNIRDGWSHTGDLAYKDIYWFVSRKSEITRPD
jgi:acyl-CoA synthetase (AMP-forming)/AMP-acid ligase II